MKKILILATLMCVATTISFGQTSGIAQKVNSPYITAKSGVNVTITVVKEKIEKGPYAKFAQQLLGATAPLSNRESYSITAASISGFTEGDPSNIYTLSDPKSLPIEAVGVDLNLSTEGSKVPASGVASESTNAPIFSDLSITPIVYAPNGSVSIDRTGTREKSVEEMAIEAANTIFTLRKRRFDLITGENSDNVFGAGLAAAIEEMNRLESEYIALFVGKKSTQTREYTFDVLPKSGQNNYVVCRFTKSGGVVDSGDVSGEPILLVVTPEGGVKQPAATKGTATKGAVTYRVADMADCKLLNSSELLVSKRLPILQFGATIDVLTTK